MQQNQFGDLSEEKLEANNKSITMYLELYSRKTFPTESLSDVIYQ